MSIKRYEPIVQSYLAERLQEEAHFERWVARHGLEEVTFPPEHHKEKATLDDACVKCIFQQERKYRQVLEQGDAKGQFIVPCQGIPREYVSPEVIRSLGGNPDDPNCETSLSLKALRDPVAWARATCFLGPDQPWIARDYQVPLLRCTSKAVVSRMGRRTGKSDALMIKALWYAIERPIVKDINGKASRPPCRILIMTPRQTHTDNLFEKFETFIRNNPVLESTIQDYKQHPYVNISFKPKDGEMVGSWIKILTGGTGTSGAGLSIRSFSADLIILDEANFLGPKELEAITAILMTNADTFLHVSSTPIGFQDFFWDYCKTRPDIKEFYAPTCETPQWEKVKSRVYSLVQTVDEFLHEYMAEFSPSSIGVFRPDLIQQAIRVYAYESQEPAPEAIYTIGVDWNSNAGTEIYVMAYSGHDDSFTGVESVNVAKSEWTQTQAIEAIIDLVTKWNPISVMVDRGYGDTQIELLKQYAISNAAAHPAIASLTETLHVYEFGGTVTIFDPMTRKEVKQPAKPFLVRNTVKRFEEGRIRIPQDDILLLDQLRSYAVKNVSEMGRPSYHSLKPDLGDHRLDALMLSLVAFTLHSSELTKRRPGVWDIRQLEEDPRRAFVMAPHENASRVSVSAKDLGRTINPLTKKAKSHYDSEGAVFMGVTSIAGVPLMHPGGYQPDTHTSQGHSPSNRGLVGPISRGLTRK